MNDWIQRGPAIAALVIYSVLVIRKAQELRKCSRRPERKILRFELIRRTADGALLASFLLSGLCPLWFGLFRSTPLGYFTGCISLVFLTLTVSVLVDWFPVKESCRLAGRQAPSYSSFLARQLRSLFLVECWLGAAWLVFLVLEPTGIHVLVRIAAAAGALLLCRWVVLWVRKACLQRKHDGR